MIAIPAHLLLPMTAPRQLTRPLTLVPQHCRCHPPMLVTARPLWIPVRPRIVMNAHPRMMHALPTLLTHVPHPPLAVTMRRLPHHPTIARILALPWRLRHIATRLLQPRIVMTGTAPPPPPSPPRRTAMIVIVTPALQPPRRTVTTASRHPVHPDTETRLIVTTGLTPVGATIVRLPLPPPMTETRVPPHPLPLLLTHDTRIVTHAPQHLMLQQHQAVGSGLRLRQPTQVDQTTWSTGAGVCHSL